MKYIITESQRNRIFENTIEKKRNWVPILTSLVEKTCEQIELSCSEIDANDFPVGVNFDICEDISQYKLEFIPTLQVSETLTLYYTN